MTSPKGLCVILVDKYKKYTNYTKNIVYNKVFNEFNISLIHSIV